jgi:hypothetical protein
MIWKEAGVIFTCIIGIVLGAVITGNAIERYMRQVEKEHYTASYNKGHKAAELNIPANANPYEYLPQKMGWLDGYMDALEKRNY